jgi:hypothetical protein
VCVCVCVCVCVRVCVCARACVHPRVKKEQNKQTKNAIILCFKLSPHNLLHLLSLNARLVFQRVVHHDHARTDSRRVVRVVVTAQLEDCLANGHQKCDANVGQSCVGHKDNVIEPRVLGKLRTQLVQRR